MEERATQEHPDKKIKATTPLSPTIEVYPTKTDSKAEHQESQKQTKKSDLKWGDKQPAITRSRRLPIKRAK